MQFHCVLSYPKATTHARNWQISSVQNKQAQTRENHFTGQNTPIAYDFKQSKFD
jgi:hypothetical protein